MQEQFLEGNLRAFPEHRAGEACNCPLLFQGVLIFCHLLDNKESMSGKDVKEGVKRAETGVKEKN